MSWQHMPLHTISLPLFPFAYAFTSTPPFVLSLLHSHFSLRQFRTAGTQHQSTKLPVPIVSPLHANSLTMRQLARFAHLGQLPFS